MDWSIAHSLNLFLFHHDAIEDPTSWYAGASEIMFLGMLVLVCLLARGERWMSIRRTAVAAGLSAGLGLLIAKLITEVYDRPRPFVTHPKAVHLFVSHARDASFPSDHCTAAMAIAIAILLRGKLTWGWICFVFTLALMYARVAVGFHYPTDVLGGAAIGALCALLLYAAPIRAAIDALSDWAGGNWDRATRALAPRGLARSPRG